MGSLLSHALSMAGTNFKLQSLGIPGKFGQSAYKADHLYARYGIGAEAIKSPAASLLKG